MPALEPGSHVGPYEVLAPIGAGGMGEVYRSRDAKLKRDVAIKVLSAEWMRDPDRIHRFQREAQVLAALNHPHIAQIYGVEDAGGTPSRLTFEPGMESFPIWSPNGDSIAFGDWTGIEKKPANGSTQAETILKKDGLVALSSWSKDGRYIAFSTKPDTGGDIDILPLAGDKKPISFLHERFEENNPQISPDSRWMAYESNESGRSEANLEHGWHETEVAAGWQGTLLLVSIKSTDGD